MEKSKFEIIQGNILDEPEWKFHQCNCRTTKAAGVAKNIFEKWPEANRYQKRIHGQNDDHLFGKIRSEEHTSELQSQR